MTHVLQTWLVTHVLEPESREVSLRIVRPNKDPWEKCLIYSRQDALIRAETLNLKTFRVYFQRIGPYAEMRSRHQVSTSKEPNNSAKEPCVSAKLETGCRALHFRQERPTFPQYFRERALYLRTRASISANQYVERIFIFDFFWWSE